MAIAAADKLVVQLSADEVDAQQPTKLLHSQGVTCPAALTVLVHHWACLSANSTYFTVKLLYHPICMTCSGSDKHIDAE